MWHPIDLLVQSGILDLRHNVTVCDAVARALTPDATLKIALESRPSAIFSLIGSMCLDSDTRFLEVLKKRTGAKIIVSGDAVLHRPGLFLKEYARIDAILFNFTSSDILSLLNGDTERVTSAAFRIDGAVEVRRNLKLDEFHYPVPMHSAFDGGAYNMPFAPAGFASVLTSFGCPYSCAFCNSGAHSLGFGFRNHDNLADEIMHLQSQGIRHIFFKDMTFGVDPKRTERLCRLFMDEAENITWHAYTRIDLLDEERIDLYAKAGCRLLQVGLETSDDEIGRRVGKRIDPAHAKEMLKLMKSKGITPGAHFVLGLPGADVKSAVRTIGFAVKLDIGYASFNVFTPRPGAELFEPGNSGKIKSFVWRMVLRAAYIRFYLRPHRILSFFKRDRAAFDNQSLMSIIRYLLFLPDMNPNDRAVLSKRAIFSNQTNYLL